MFNQCSFVSYLYCVCDIKYIYLISVAIWIEFWFFDRICRFECPTKTFSNRNDKIYCMNKHRIVQNKTVAVWSVYNILIFASDFWHDMYSYLLSIYLFYFDFQSALMFVCVSLGSVCRLQALNIGLDPNIHEWMNMLWLAILAYPGLRGKSIQRQWLHLTRIHRISFFAYLLTRSSVEHVTYCDIQNYYAAQVICSRLHLV